MEQNARMEHHFSAEDVALIFEAESDCQNESFRGMPKNMLLELKGLFPEQAAKWEWIWGNIE